MVWVVCLLVLLSAAPSHQAHLDRRAQLCNESPPTDAVVHYSFDSTLLNLGSSGDNNDAELFGATVTSGGGVFGGALQTGTSGYATLGASGVSLSTPWSVSVWVQIPNPSSPHSLTLLASQSAETQLYLDRTGHLVTSIHGRRSYWESALTRLLFDDGLWHHIVILSDGHLYIDGGSSSAAFPINTPLNTISSSSLYEVGGDNTGFSGSFAQYIDEFKFFDRLLSESEINAIYESTINGCMGTTVATTTTTTTTTPITTTTTTTTTPATPSTTATTTPITTTTSPPVTTAITTPVTTTTTAPTTTTTPTTTISTTPIPTTTTTPLPTTTMTTAPTTTTTTTAAAPTTTGTTTCSPAIPSGADLYMSFDGLDLNSATIPSDPGSNLNTIGALLSGAALSTGGLIGNALAFTQSTGVMILGDPTLGDPTLGNGFVLGDSWTLSAWIYNLYPNSQPRTLFRSQPHWGTHHCLTIGDDLGTYDNTLDEAQGFHPCGGDVSSCNDNNWHHITAVGTSGTTLIYVDGLYIGTSDWQSTDPVYSVGNDGDDTTQPFASFLDEVRIWATVALSDSDVAQLTEGVLCRAGLL